MLKPKPLTIEEMIAKLGINIRQIWKEKHWFILLHEPCITVEAISLKVCLKEALKHTNRKYHKAYLKDLKKRDRGKYGF